MAASIPEWQAGTNGFLPFQGIALVKWVAGPAANESLEQLSRGHAHCLGANARCCNAWGNVKP